MSKEIEILIVEDSPTQAIELQAILERHGYQISVARNGEEALTHINNHKPAMVISDIVMPVMDGYELCRRIKTSESLRDIPVMLLTSLSDPKDVITGLECGADNFATKPYNEEFLLCRIQYVLEHRDMYRSDKGEMDIEIFFEGQEYSITSNRRQILDFLLSTYEDAVQKNLELIKVQNDLRLEITERRRVEKELRRHRHNLEEIVEERTAELTETNAELQREIAERKRVEAALKEERTSLAQRVEERTADLRKANGELARAARLKDEFLASMSHELRTPLNAILGMSESLQEEIYGPLNERQTRSLRIVEESGRHLLDLINDILDVSKIEAGKLDLQYGTVLVQSVCQASLQFIKQDALKKRLKVSSNFDTAVAKIQADPRRLKQILVNLLNNAVKFTLQDGAIGLEVTGNAEQEMVHFTVWDTGIGISQDQIEHLFMPFIQLDSSLSRQYAGTGLGLTLVQRLTEMHGGSVSVESQVGKGSRFTVSMPWQEPAEVVEEVEETESDTADLSSIHKVLIVEDSPTAAAWIASCLAELGVESAIHERGEGVVDRALEIQPDVILLDILLPGIDGWDVLPQLKAEPRTQDIPVFITSVMDERSRGLALGAAGYLIKPVSFKQLQQVLSQVAHPQTEELPTFVESFNEDPEVESPLILMAEDNEDNINAVMDYLLAEGYRMAVARNGSDAIQRAREERPRVILMDIQMPGMDGLEAMRQIRSDADLADIPIIALTALAMHGDRERCLKAGADDYMSKPVRLKELARAIKEQLNRTRLESAVRHETQ